MIEKQQCYIGKIEIVQDCFKIFGWIGIVYFIFSCFIDCYQASIYFDGYSTDGTFQLYNALRRLEDGQIPGIDFPFFHGIGILYFHYPIFALLGKSLFAAEMSRSILSPIFFLISSYLFLYVCTKNKNLSLFLTALSVYFAYNFFICILYSANSLMGIRSSVPLWLGTFILFYLDKYSQNPTKKKYFLYTLGIVFGITLAFLCGVEHGLACLVAYSLFHFFYRKPYTNIKIAFLETAAIFFSCLACIFLFFVFLCGKSFWKPLQYYLLEIPGDQFWYFGAPPSPFLSSFQDIIGYYYYAQNISFLSILYGILLLVITYYIQKKNPIPILKGIYFLLVYGILSAFSLFGIYLSVYTESLLRIEFLITVYYLFELFPLWLFQKKSAHSTRIVWGYNLSLVFLLFFFLYRLYFPNVCYSLENFLKSEKLHENKILGVYLSPRWYKHLDMVNTHISIPRIVYSVPITNEEWQRGIHKKSSLLLLDYSKKMADTIKEDNSLLLKKSGQRKIQKIEIAWDNLDGIRKKYIKLHLEGGPLDPERDGYPQKIFLLEKEGRKPSVWSTYASIVEAFLEEYHPDTDYIIHALGPCRREKYIESFKKAKCDYAITIKNNWLYGHWLLNSHWDFYEKLIEDYDILCVTPTHLLWKRKQKTGCLKEKEWEGVFKNLDEQNEVVLPINRQSDSYELLVIQVEYEIKNPWKGLPLFGNIPRYFIEPCNAHVKQPVSLPPYYEKFRFPLFLKDKANPKLQFSLRSMMPGVHFKVKSLSYRYLDASQETKENIFGIFP